MTAPQLPHVRLVMVEWEDSAQPTSSWVFLSDFTEPTVIRCVSVGWLIHDGQSVKSLAPNFGSVNDEASLQVSGVINIPASCIVRITDLAEPDLSEDYALSA